MNFLLFLGDVLLFLCNSEKFNKNNYFEKRKLRPSTIISSGVHYMKKLNDIILI